MSTRFDLIVFDYDGVVADSELLNNQVMAELLTEAGLPTTLDEAIAGYMGRSWRDIEPELAERIGRPCPELQELWTERCALRAAAELQAVAGLHAFLDERPEQRCVASSSPPPWIELGLARFGLAPDALGPIFSGAVHVARGKPHPDLFLHAADALGVRPERAVIIEDSPAGVRGGVAAGMTVIGLCAGGHIRDGHADALLRAGAHQVVGDYASVSRLLDADPTPPPA